MSDCDWQGMGVFGTQVLAPGPGDLPSTEIRPFAQAAVEEVTPTTEVGGDFTNLTVNVTPGDILAVTLTRTRKTRAVLVALNLAGTVSGFSTISDLAFRVLVNDFPVTASPTGGTEQLLVRKVSLNLVPGETFFQPNFSLSMVSLIPPEVLPNLVDLDFRVQFHFLATGLTSPQVTVFPREDALVIKEIGPFSLT